MLDTSHVYYMGASQGGIMGGALTAISPDAVQAALLVGAMNYSILLPRSVDYAPYSPLLNNAYTDETERPMLLSLVQMLWDRGEPNGYAHVMTTSPPPDTPPHNLSLMVAVGDRLLDRRADLVHVIARRELVQRATGCQQVVADVVWQDADVGAVAVQVLVERVAGQLKLGWRCVTVLRGEGRLGAGCARTVVVAVAAEEEGGQHDRRGEEQQ